MPSSQPNGAPVSDVMRRAEEVVPALVLHPPEGGHHPRRVRAVADDGGAEVVDERPEEDGDEEGRACEHDQAPSLDEAAELPRRAACPPK